MNQPFPRLDAPVPVPSPSGWTAEIVDLDWLIARSAAWDRLLARALAPAPFFSRAVVCAHALNGVASAGLRFVVVRRGEELGALLPVRPQGARLGITRRAHTSWTSPYVTNATPLVAADALPEALDALLDGLAALSPPGFWLLPLLSLDHPVAVALVEALRRRGWPAHILSRFARPVMARRPADAPERLKPGRRRSLRRRLRRLAEQGTLTVRSVTEGRDLSEAAEAFLALEAAGWKGARRTALASRPDTAALVRDLFGQAETGGVAARVDTLNLDGRPIAASLALVCAGTAHLWRTAYDERHRAFAPGLLLEDAIIQTFQDTGFADRLDTASIAGSVLDEFYPDREPIGDLAFASDAQLAPTFHAALRREEARRAAVTQLKAALKAWHAWAQERRAAIGSGRLIAPRDA